MRRLVIVAGLFLGIVQCSSQQVQTSDTASGGAQSSANWAVRMQGMAKDLEGLMPYVFSRQEFNAPENKGKVRGMIEKFEKSVEVVPQHAGEEMLGKDPLVKFAISRLRSNTHHARKAFEEGHVEFSRNILSENMGLCFSCHTTSEFGPQNAFSEKVLSSDFRILPSERAEYYVATRQFDRAVSLLEGVLKTPGNLMDDPHEQVSSLRKYLSLQVRVKKDPAGAASLLENFLNNQKLPYFLATDAESWLKSLREWQKEGGKSEEAYKRAQNLLRKAKMKQSSQGYQSAYVDYLRASALLHEALRQNKDAKVQGQIYQLLGASYDTLAETGTWDLPEVYFEACIRSVPNTALAKSCYKDFERSIILGFSGSAGIFIPKEERDRLAELKMLAGLKQ